jgi:hypothetical protein
MMLKLALKQDKASRTNSRDVSSPSALESEAPLTPMTRTKHKLLSPKDEDKMDVDANILEKFLSSKIYVSTLDEGFFAVLMKDLRKEVWSHISDDKTFAIAMRVNKKWREELVTAWHKFCVERAFFDSYWDDKGKDWKWQLKCYVIHFKSDEVKNCPGTFEDTNGPYSGDYQENKQEGWGKKVFTDKSVYMGQWHNNLKHGEGTYIWEDKTSYVGAWKDDKYHGYGVKRWSDGDRYEGIWAEDRKHGYGTYIWSNGDRYDGEWLEDKQHGPGVFVWSTGVKYVGMFKDNMRSDDCATLTWPNGDRYEGGFKENLIEGHGTYKHASGDMYIGEWKASQRHGKAHYIYQYGGRFEGHFQEDQRNGLGVFEWPDGDRFEGQWKDGGRYGRGIFITKDGRVFDQEWRENPQSNYAEKVPAKHPDRFAR